jgi:hypothetical protein
MRVPAPAAGTMAQNLASVSILEQKHHRKSWHGFNLAKYFLPRKHTEKFLVRHLSSVFFRVLPWLYYVS